MSKETNRTIEIGQYSFTETGHKHLLDGKPLTGVTTVLGVLKKPALLPWASKMAVEYVKEQLDHSYRVIRPIESDGKNIFHWYELEETVLDSILDQAKTAYAKKRDKAGDSGTLVHAIIENIVKEAIRSSEGILDPKLTHTEPQVQNFLTWAKGKRFIASEIHVFSEGMFIGGICDVVYEEESKLYLGDFKTGSGIYPEMFWQMGAYHLCMKEMGLYEGVDGYTVVNLKKDGKMNVETVYGLDMCQEGFKHCLGIYRLLNATKQLI